MRTSKNKEFAYAMRPFKILSWSMGIWPLQVYNSFAFIRYLFVVGILLLMVVILSTEMYLDGSDAEANLDALMMSGCGILAVSKVTCFRIYSSRLIINFSSAAKDYNELDNELDNDDEKRTIMRRHAYMAKVTLISMVFSANFCAAIFAILPVLLSNEEESNVTVEDTVTYPMPSAHVIELVKFPESLQLIVFFTEFLMLVVTSMGNLGSDAFFFGIVFHLCGQVEILKMKFSRAIDDSGRGAENLHLLINRHDYLLKLSVMLNDTISLVLAMQLLSSCILICTCGFQFILALHDGNVVMVIKTFIILSTLMIQLYGYSYVGNYLKCQMDEIGYSSYNCSWYKLPTNVAKDIVIVILNAQKPVHLMAGKFFVVNLEGFMSILKTSMSYLSVLRVMINA
ncbi:odorant receptor 47a-like isoform X1 [Osmia bicornis bicornis]|uniref:odorant receptor 47a-like isoform X1 n=2 Tax=Osmia bicornis bicornis TaxID=1437191 RepID=UPI0010F505D3|nr:odorant receptor 47a-like isoform X1 [Osmia bicornis bicornis]